MLKTFTNLPILTFILGWMRNRWLSHSSLAFRELEEYKRIVSSRSSGGTMTPPGLELHQN
jgi:hypothetical protein